MSGYSILALGVVGIIVGGLIGIAIYVWSSLVTYRALQAAKYDKAWMAWVPFLNYYALADVTKDEGENTKVLNAFEVPNWLYQFFWVVLVITTIFNINGTVEWILNIACSVIFLGTIYTKLFAWHDKVSEDEKRTMGIVSGIFNVVAWVIMSGWKAEDTIERPAKIDVVDAPENNDAN